MNQHDAEIRKAREILAQMEHCFSYFKSFIERQHQLLISLADESPKDADITVVRDTEKSDIYDNQTLARYLKVTPKTLKRYRDEGLLSFTQVYGKIWYSQKDVDDFLSKRHVEPL
jgi:hypothetical protein